MSIAAPGSKDFYFPTQYSQSFFTQCMACFWKQRLSYWRNPPYTAVRLFFTSCMALILGTIFWDIGSKRKKHQDVLNAIGCMYATVSFIGFHNCTQVQPVVAIERTVFYRERAAGMYSALPYAFGQVAIELPYILIQAIIYGAIVYPMMGFELTVSKFLWYTCFMYITFLYFTFFGMMTVGLTPNHNISVIVSSSLFAIWDLFSGFIIPKTRMPIWWRWYFWVCPVSWSLYGLVASQYGDIKDTFESSDQTVEEFLNSYFGYKTDFLSVVAIVLVGISVIFGFIFGYSIKTFNFQQR